MQVKIFYSIAIALVLTITTQTACAQQEDEITDSLYIAEVQRVQGPAKVLHAEPLFIDLIRDLGARKGEREWNVGLGLTDNLGYDTYQALVEYEFAPADRLGLEVELPFTYYAEHRGTPKDNVPAHRIESIKTAIQWTFMVKPRHNFSAAIGYINEVELNDLDNMDNKPVTGNVFNPFVVAARRWGNNWHTLVYTGPRIVHGYWGGGTHSQYHINTNLHYMIPGTRNFIGVEVNKVMTHHDFDMTIRPQLRLSVTDNLLVGIVGGIPVKRENERLSTFARVIWEPGNKHH